MPNHCKNLLTIVGPKEDVSAFVNRARAPDHVYKPEDWQSETGGQVEPLSFQVFAPIPDNVLACGYNDLVPGTNKQAYEWERDLWGVKWGAYETVLRYNRNGAAMYEFTTAWAPPDRWLEKVSQQYPELIFLFSYGEERPTRGRRVLCAGKALMRCDESYDESLFEKEHKAYLKKHEVEENGEDDEFWSLWENELLGSHQDWAEQAAAAAIAEKVCRE